MHFAYQMLSFTSPGFLFSVHVYARVRTSISILRFLAQGKGFARESGASRAFVLSSALLALNCSKSPRARPEPLRAAQNRSERAQSCSEPPRAFAQSCSRNRSGSPRAAQSHPRAVAQGRPEPLRIAQRAPRAAKTRPERSPKAAPSEEPLRIARSVTRAAQSRSELLEKPIGELCVTCALCISDAHFYFTWFPLLRACICTGSH